MCTINLVQPVKGDNKNHELIRNKYLDIVSGIGKMHICKGCGKKYFGISSVKNLKVTPFRLSKDSQDYLITGNGPRGSICGIERCEKKASYSLLRDDPKYGVVDLRSRFAVLGKISHPRILSIDFDFYEPIPEKPGYVRSTGRKTIGEVYEELCARLKAQRLYPDEYFSLEKYDIKKEAPFPNGRLCCFAVTGGSEGHYIHLEIIDYDDDSKRKHLVLGKTFNGMDFAYEVAKACAKHLGA